MRFEKCSSREAFPLPLFASSTSQKQNLFGFASHLHFVNATTDRFVSSPTLSFKKKFSTSSASAGEASASNAHAEAATPKRAQPKQASAEASAARAAGTSSCAAHGKQHYLSKPSKKTSEVRIDFLFLEKCFAASVFYWKNTLF